MEQIMKEMMDMGMKQFMDKSRKELSMSDAVYLEDCKDERELEQRYMELDLTRRQRMLVNDYVACTQTTYNRYAEISYVTGVKDAIKMLFQLGLLKGIKRLEEDEQNLLNICQI